MIPDDDTQMDMELSREHYPQPGRPILSPLRFPGSKRRLVSYIKKVIKINKLDPRLFIEPFAGGASIALQLMCDDVVEVIALADKDSLIASFWKCVFFNTEWLVEAIASVDVTLENWERFKNQKSRSDQEKALKCIFLNRTSFSGILAPSAGPLGGKKQESKYSISCRFPKAKIIKRILQASEFRDRVLFIKRQDWSETIKNIQKLITDYDPRDMFIYLDPPFYNKSHRLYTHFFLDNDHIALHKTVSNVVIPWVLSYDPAQPILELYRSNGTQPNQVEVLYSASSNSGSYLASELIISNLQKLPLCSHTFKSTKMQE